MQLIPLIAANWAILPLVRGHDAISDFGEKTGLEEDQKLVDSLRKRMGIEQEVTVVATPMKGMFEFFAHGCTLLPFGNAISVPQTSDKAKWESVSNVTPFIYAHELRHIENQTILRIAAVGLVVNVVALVVLSLFVPLELAMLAALTASVAAVIYTSWEEEIQADVEACKCLSDIQIAEAILWFDDIKFNAKQAREQATSNSIKDTWKRLTTGPNGDSYFDFFHPSFERRILHLTQMIKSEAFCIQLNLYRSQRHKTSEVRA